MRDFVIGFIYNKNNTTHDIDPILLNLRAIKA